MALLDLGTSFTLGLLTPLTAVCVLPLYPAFISFLTTKFEDNASKKTYALFGLTVTLGVLIFMTLLGLIFTTFLQESLTNVIGIISPIAFGILIIISVFLILDFDFSRIFSKLKVNVNTQNKHPLWSALLFGLFFGAIVLPCNPGFIVTFFAREILSSSAGSLLNFFMFGLGLGTPLLAFTILSANWSSKIIGFLSKHKTKINRGAGIIMLLLSLYFLIFDFKILG